MRAGGKHSPETRAKIAAATKGRICSTETRAKISVNSRNRSPEAIAKSVAVLNSQESREKSAATMRLPETQAKRYATMQTNAAVALGLNADQYENYSSFKLKGYSRHEAVALARGERLL